MRKPLGSIDLDLEDHSEKAVLERSSTKSLALVKPDGTFVFVMYVPSGFMRKVFNISCYRLVSEPI